MWLGGGVVLSLIGFVVIGPLLAGAVVRVLGAVLNDVRAGDAYGYYAYYSYLPGYEASDEGEPDEREPARQLTGE